MKNLQSLASIKSLGSRSGGAGIIYLIQDTFSTDLAAGAVNGTQADIGGVRTVTDTNTVMSISGGKLTFATGGAAGSGIWYPSQARVAGKVLLGEMTQTSGDTVNFGWDSNQTGAIADGMRMAAAGSLQILRAGGALVAGVYTQSSTYAFAFVMKGTGIYIL